MEAFYLALFAGIAGSVAVLELAKAPEAHAGSPDFTWLRRNFVTVYALMMGAAPRFRIWGPKHLAASSACCHTVRRKSWCCVCQ